MLYLQQDALRSNHTLRREEVLAKFTCASWYTNTGMQGRQKPLMDRIMPLLRAAEVSCEAPLQELQPAKK